MKAPQDDPRNARPTRTAYRYLRKTTGWQPSRRGNQLEHNDIPHTNESDDEETFEEDQPTTTYDDISEFSPPQQSSALLPLADQAAVDVEAAV